MPSIQSQVVLIQCDYIVKMCGDSKRWDFTWCARDIEVIEVPGFAVLAFYPIDAGWPAI